MNEKPRPVRVRAVPWVTPTEEKVKGALGEIPAYLRRASRTERALERLLEEAGRTREEMLRFVRIRRRRHERSGDARTREALRASIRRFNRRWETWVRCEAPLDAVNAEIEGYNRHFPIERQCALKYVPANRVPFQRKERITPEDLLRRFPLLSED